MTEHASVFYVTPANKYMLCTDSEIEDLVTKRTRIGIFKSNIMIADTLEPFHIITNKLGRHFMRIIYNPEKTEQLRRPDGYVDRFVEFDDNWMNNHLIAFDVAYPGGLPLDLIVRYKKPEVRC